jgi:hypothetical protein
MKTTKILLVCIAMGMGLTNIRAQEATAASGGTASNNSGTVNYSIGQIVYTANSGATGSVSQGIQQPYEIYNLGTDDFPNISLKMLIYPNPTMTSVNLQIQGLTYDKMEYQLFDIMGKEISNQKISQSETQIPLENLPSATYLLNVSNQNKIIKSFKIIKTN